MQSWTRIVLASSGLLAICTIQALAFVLPSSLPSPRYGGMAKDVTLHAMRSNSLLTKKQQGPKIKPLFASDVPTERGISGTELAVDVPPPEEELPVSFREAPLKAIMQRWKKATKIDRKQLAALGASALCSYGLVSNINYCGTMCIAYVIHAQKYNKSIFAAGQWKPFLAIYGGLWAAMNFLRPIRIWLALGLTPYFDKAVDGIKNRFGVKRGVAFGMTVFLINVCGTLTFLTTGLYLASLYTKVPLFPPKLTPKGIV